MSELPSVPGFTLERVLGAGAYGRVYLARETTGLRRLVALKRFSSAEAFTREQAMQTRIEELRRQGRHAGIVPAFASGEHDGQGWIAFEYMEGGSLADRVATDGPLAWSDALRMILEATSAVAVLHEAGLFHRDLKPSNLLLGSDGAVRVGDFGLARELDGSLSAAGSPAFAPPEVIAGQVDSAQRARVDVYGLGATLAYLITGEPARPGRPDAFALTRRNAPRPVIDALLSAMAYEPDERPADARALLQQLQGVAENLRSPRASSADPEGVGKEDLMKATTHQPTPVRDDLDLTVDRPRCPYCHDAVSPHDAKHACQHCMAWHHAACWKEASAGCSACGAGEANPARQPVEITPGFHAASVALNLVALLSVSTTTVVGLLGYTTLFEALVLLHKLLLLYAVLGAVILNAISAWKRAKALDDCSLLRRWGPFAIACCPVLGISLLYFLGWGFRFQRRHLPARSRRKPTAIGAIAAACLSAVCGLWLQFHIQVWEQTLNDPKTLHAAVSQNRSMPSHKQAEAFEVALSALKRRQLEPEEVVALSGVLAAANAPQIPADRLGALEAALLELRVREPNNTRGRLQVVAAIQAYLDLRGDASHRDDQAHERLRAVASDDPDPEVRARAAAVVEALAAESR